MIKINFGAWKMKTKLLPKSLPLLQKRSRLGKRIYEGFVFPEGEAVADFLCRTKEMLAVLTASSSHVTAVTHGGVIRAMLCAAQLSAL